jgi:hypothetical protein
MRVPGQKFFVPANKKKAIAGSTRKEYAVVVRG